MFLQQLKFFSYILFHQKYNYFIQKGLELKDVAPLEDSCLENIKGMVPCHLRSLNAPLELLVDQIKEDYLFSMKTAICVYFFVLAFNRCKHITYMHACDL